MKMRYGKCPSCGREIAISELGFIKRHGPKSERCDGYGQPPVAGTLRVQESEQPSSTKTAAIDVRSRLAALSVAVDGLDAIYDRGARQAKSHDAGLELARAVVAYFGTEPLDPLLTSDIALLACARAIVAEVEGRP